MTFSFKPNARPIATHATGIVNQRVDAVYVLSVKTFSERIAHVREECARHKIAFEFIFEHDAAELDEDAVSHGFGESTLSIFHKSLVLKHIQAWKNAEAHGFKRILVFEDDVILTADFCSRFADVMNALEKMPASILVFLGGANTKVPDHFIQSKETLVALPIATAEAYITDLDAIRKRLQWLRLNRITLPADHLIRQIDQQSQIANYWSRYPLVEQGSVMGKFSSMLDSHRQKHSALFNKLRYHWSKFQRHALRNWLWAIRSKFKQ